GATAGRWTGFCPAARSSSSHARASRDSTRSSRRRTVRTSWCRRARTAASRWPSSSVAPWTEPAWLAEAHLWIDAQLDRLALVPEGTVEQRHVRPWATALRIPTTDGVVWFKAAIPVLAHEPGVVELISRRLPGLVPELLATDLGRGWMLMADGGQRLRELLE